MQVGYISLSLDDISNNISQSLNNECNNIPTIKDETIKDEEVKPDNFNVDYARDEVSRNFLNRRFYTSKFNNNRKLNSNELNKRYLKYSVLKYNSIKKLFIRILKRDERIRTVVDICNEIKYHDIVAIKNFIRFSKWPKGLLSVMIEYVKNNDKLLDEDLTECKEILLNEFIINNDCNDDENGCNDNSPINLNGSIGSYIRIDSCDNSKLDKEITTTTTRIFSCDNGELDKEIIATTEVDKKNINNVDSSIQKDSNLDSSIHSNNNNCGNCDVSNSTSKNTSHTENSNGNYSPLGDIINDEKSIQSTNVIQKVHSKTNVTCENLFSIPRYKVKKFIELNTKNCGSFTCNGDIVKKENLLDSILRHMQVFLLTLDSNQNIIETDTLCESEMNSTSCEPDMKSIGNSNSNNNPMILCLENMILKSLREKLNEYYS